MVGRGSSSSRNKTIPFVGEVRALSQSQDG